MGLVSVGSIYHPTCVPALRAGVGAAVVTVLLSFLASASIASTRSLTPFRVPTLARGPGARPTPVLTTVVASLKGA